MNLTLPNVNGDGEIQLEVIKAICGDTSWKSMIDLGCGFAPTTRRLGFTNRFYIDIVERDLKEENENFIQRDILEFIEWMFPVKLDVAISCDMIEHFWEDDGRKIIKWMEDNSRKPIIFTPLGRYMNVDDKSNTDPDTHKYSWLDTQFQEMGWATITLPHFHPTLGEGGLGAFFGFKCENLEEEFERVKSELKNKSWIR